MNLWLAAATALLFCLIPIGIACLRGEAIDRLIGLEAAGAVATIELEMLAEGFRRTSFFDLPLALALLAFAGGLVFARFFERWM
jgi:multicomponent Na+:H+ antiporter subunit F